MRADFYIPILVMLAASLVFLVRLGVFQRRLYAYLRENHTEKWKELTTILSLGPGYANSWRGLKFVFGKDDLGDQEVLRLKVVVRNSCIYVITGFLATFVLFVMMVSCSVGLNL